MSYQQDDLSQSPYYLSEEASEAAIKTIAAIGESLDRVRGLTVSLAIDKQLPSEQDTIWLLSIARAALLKLEPDVRLEEYHTRRRQEASQPADVSSSELNPIPEWLKLPEMGA